MGGWKAVVFDLDGTLTDTLGDLAAATNEALRRHGFPACPLESYRHMVGNGARKLIERALGGACTPERTEPRFCRTSLKFMTPTACGIPGLTTGWRRRSLFSGRRASAWRW